MKKRSRIELFYMLYTMVVRNLRAQVKEMAVAMGRTGRGKTTSSAARQLQNMYEMKISLKPNLMLLPFENSRNTAYFCRKKDRKDVFSTFNRLREDERMSYVLFLSGCYDFFITSRVPGIDSDLVEYGLTIEEKSVLSTPTFIVPRGWRLSMGEAMKSFLESGFTKGAIKREVHGVLEWSELDWRIYQAMREDARREFAVVGREVGAYSTTAKTHFYEKVLPCCTVTHYFFPKGYDFYKQAFLRVHTEYEKSIVSALEKLPCTTYVFPLEKSLLLNIFHESINETMAMIQKMEEVGIIDDYLLFVPLKYVI